MPAVQQQECKQQWLRKREMPVARCTARAAPAALQVIQVDILIAVNHVGRMDMTVCDLDAKVGQDYKCHQLQR